MAAPCGLGSEYKTDDLAYHALRHLQPKIKEERAKRIATALQKVALKCGVDWRLLASIAYHESSLDQSKINTKTRDYGLMQINEKNILRYGLSRDKIMTDAAYSVDIACKLLKDNQKRYSAKYSYWVGIYRSGTALWNKSIRDNAQSYDNMIRLTANELGYTESL